MIEFKESSRGYLVRLQESKETIGAIWKRSDGDYVYFPNKYAAMAYLDASELKQIADKLESLNNGF